MYFWKSVFGKQSKISAALTQELRGKCSQEALLAAPKTLHRKALPWHVYQKRDVCAETCGRRDPEACEQNESPRVQVTGGFA